MFKLSRNLSASDLEISLTILAFTIRITKLFSSSRWVYLVHLGKTGLYFIVRNCMIEAVDNILHKIMFSDEVMFKNVGTVNKHKYCNKKFYNINIKWGLGKWQRALKKPNILSWEKCYLAFVYQVWLCGAGKSLSNSDRKCWSSTTGSFGWISNTCSFKYNEIYCTEMLLLKKFLNC